MFRLTRPERFFIVCVLSAVVLGSAAKVWWRGRHPLRSTPSQPELFRDTPKNSKTGPVEDHD